MSLRRGVAALLEWERPLPAWDGLFGWPSPLRRLALPAGLAVVGVGGSTLGGSGRTPFAIALAGALAARGHRVAVLSHAYRARLSGPCLVAPGDRPRDVGDEATLAARALAGSASVISSRDRASGLAFARGLADVVVVDRLLQTTPDRVACAVLAVDARRAWGSGRLLPLGDLVASPRALVAAADEVASIGGPEASSEVTIEGDGEGRFGLLTSVARPERVSEALADSGRRPVLHVKRGDHAPFSRVEIAALRALAQARRLAGWWADAKAVAWLEDASAARALGVPVHAIRHRLELSPPLVDRIERRIRASIPRR